MAWIEYPSPGWYFNEVQGPQPLPPMPADSHAVALMECRPLIGAVDGTGRWTEDQVRARFRCTPLEWFVATIELQHLGYMTYAMYAALPGDVPWRDIALEEIAQGSITSQGLLWLAQRYSHASQADSHDV